MGPVTFQAFLGLSWRQAGPLRLSYLTSNRWADPRGLLRVSEKREVRDGAREGSQQRSRKGRSWEEGEEAANWESGPVGRGQEGLGS